MGSVGKGSVLVQVLLYFFDHRTFLVKVPFLICPTEVCLEDL